MNSRQGRFITFEGPDGSGKTAQLDILAEEFIQAGYPILRTREPGGTPISDQIRATLLDLKNTAMIDRTEALLYQAARAQLVEEVIKPQLARGGIVLSDRYADSTLAYQGYGHQNTVTSLEGIIHYATGGLVPDLTILLDLAPEVGLQRRLDAGGLNRLDAYDINFHHRVRDGYLKLAEADPGRWIVVDADRTFNVVQQDLRAILQENLDKWGY
ncbi:MAG TPA: dTMP kinase [Chloroflexi bacterium]|nr:MAG: dTMP kinase [Chloroflexota bacterium]HDD55486.1 dTMP kinase [Chloroflexota bacterium]